MQLFHMWKEAFTFFAPSNLKVWSLVSINAARHTYKTWLRYFWPLLVVYLVAGSLCLHIPMTSEFFVAIATFGLFVTLIISMRPSIKRKTMAYFYDYRWHMAVLALFFFADFFVALEHLSQPVLTSYIFTPIFLIPLATLVLFYCDAHASVRDFFVACWRTIKLLWYGLPFYCILIVVTGICYQGISFVLWELFFPLAHIFRTVPLNVFYGLFYSLFVHVVLMIFSVIPAAFAASFYTKKVHDYSERFFG